MTEITIKNLTQVSQRHNPMPFNAWCCKCNKPVDKVEKEIYDYKPVYRYFVTCHGERQEQDLEAAFIQAQRFGLEIKIEAFKDVPLIEKQKELTYENQEETQHAGCPAELLPVNKERAEENRD